MRHKLKRLAELNTWVQKSSNVIRNLITSLIKSWEIVTTPKRAKVLKSEIDKLFSSLLNQFNKYQDEKDVKREVIRIVKSIIYTEEEWKKVANDLLMRYKKEWKTCWFTNDYKLWFRAWDSVEKILVRLV